ncbi:L-serine ammonia-lyase, iron-sulfur-dependent, subunit alpha [Enterococcus durans]|uniref:L-serine ammonia-lyase, iron-sulfur-dependent, subunit alpha n=1 Tax=Enterococcus durans TaxID=53345 RepID=UPI0028915474|nr:L-serine ammonia-lyase, iron-sulfur-dependent, subunit alpha [Enterococcus durans]MDT2835934.1 L-serine ammonia-lyase, iron-sulfur-dependent, subunit alpha [Enterococcus durans]
MVTIAELISLAADSSLSEVMIDLEMKVSGRTKEDIWGEMARNLVAMEQAVEKGLTGVASVTGFSGSDAPKLTDYLEKMSFFSGKNTLQAARNAIATNELNASMGVICATPTAGSAGVCAGVITMMKEVHGVNENQQVNFLFTAGAVGLAIANQASISGAQGGCQAEVGSASAMASAGLVELAGGTPEQCGHAVALTLMNTMGLVCDPVAGLVEIPCITRNAMGASLALLTADMALAGIKSAIPADEVIQAMDQVGRKMPTMFKETAEGGLADTPTGRKIAAQLFGK